jgi:phospholipid/cholesterol/gamma-HCH transport system substrate-binding protein
LNEVKVGLLTLMAIASLIVVSLKITANKSGFGDYVEYRTILNDASGIYDNASIKVAGINAGKVKAITLSGSQALITFEVLEDIKITRFSVLKIKSVGFLGDKYLDIYLGSPNAERLKPGSMVPAEGGGGFEQLGKDAGEVLEEVKVIAKSLREAMVDENNNNMVKGIFKNVSSFTEDIKEFSKTLNAITQRNEAKLQKVVDNLTRISDQLAFETDRYADGSLMNDLERLDPVMNNLNTAMNDIKDIVADVKAGKGTVGRLMRDDEVVDQVSETLSGVNRMLGRINNFQANIMLYSGVNDKYGAKTQLDVDLIPSTERFFRGGVVVAGFGPNYETETTTTTQVGAGAPTTTFERELESQQYRFNLQIGRQVQNFALRAGLIETSGGVGIDYILPNNGFIATLEAFDYQDDVGFNVRALTEFRLWNVLYTRIAGEDLTNSGNTSYTISAGLRINDEDLAALVGVLAN